MAGGWPTAISLACYLVRSRWRWRHLSVPAWVLPGDPVVPGCQSLCGGRERPGPLNEIPTPLTGCTGGGIARERAVHIGVADQGRQAARGVWRQMRKTDPRQDRQP